MADERIHTGEDHDESPEQRSSGREISRRALLRNAAAGGVVVAVSAPLARTALRSPVKPTLITTGQPLPGGSLDPTTIPKYVTPLRIVPAMPLTGTVDSGSIDYYSIAVRQFGQQILPPSLPATTIWGYGSTSSPGTFGFPSRTIEATTDRQVRVSWANQLVDRNGNYLPHLVTVDPTLHWANPPGGASGRDSVPTFTSTPGPYTGPVPLVTHLHGGPAGCSPAAGFPFHRAEVRLCAGCVPVCWPSWASPPSC